jgi:hypothetical protein
MDGGDVGMTELRQFRNPSDGSLRPRQINLPNVARKESVSEMIPYRVPKPFAEL